ncbi:ABC transporter substrate-binding protein [Nitrosomonas sp. sh817]|uniref:ABC transporter substrate-binding protein n=1 Tax=Nitrosomonas sp. sh817 TaxID=3070658 RepID=UPI0027DDD815|nr:ABC transporter substrate-binding protein [Nitrosomonas sp. sh817]WMJ08435.1 ABC transporter substrate-binding protein [Nitrosomonas sp. sh817]
MKAKQTVNILEWCLMLVMLLPISAALSAAESETRNPEQVIQYLQSSLLHVMQDGEKLGYDGRYKYLEPVIDQSHDVDLIIKTILGATYWSQLDATQQNLMVETFRQLSIATYAGRFTHHEGEQFRIIEQRDLPRDQVLVRSQLTQSDGGTVNFDYVLHQDQGHWRITNILFDGVSDLAIKRGEYRAILQRSGFQALIDMLKEKITSTRLNPQ